MTWTPNTALRAGASVAVLASGALLLAACGSGSSGTGSADAKSSAAASSSSSAAAKAGGAADMQAYRDCLAKNGVKLPSFSPGAGRPSGRPSGMPSSRPSGMPSGGFRGGMGGASADPQMQKAAKACASVRPTFNGGRMGGGADSSAMQAFTSCLKDHGVTVPSSSANATSRPRGGGFLGGLNTADPKVAKAYKTCRPLLPQHPSASPSAT